MSAPSPPASYHVTPANIDGSMRYWMVIEQFKDLYRGDLDVLEVGSGSGGVTEFLHHPVTGVDTAFERTSERATPFLTPVEASATSLPMADESFDVVLCCEMVEHLPHDDRPPAFSEMLRVLRPGGRVVVTFPADATARRLDTWLNEGFGRRYGRDHPWAVEHLREGVPSTEEIVEVVRAQLGPNDRLRIRKHAWSGAWKLQMGLYSINRGYPLTKLAGLHTRPVATALFRTLRHLNRGECYRTVVLVDKH